MPAGELSGKVAIVTGGGRGIGRAMALGLATAGANVLITAARNPAEIEISVALPELTLDTIKRAQDLGISRVATLPSGSDRDSLTRHLEGIANNIIACL